MKSKLTILSLAICAGLFLFPSRSSAQGCRSVMNPEYSTYVTYTTDGTYLYSDVELEGYATINYNELQYCPGINLNSAAHTPSIRNTIGGAGGTTTYSPVGITANIEENSSVPITFNPAQEYAAAYDGEVACLYAGTLYYASGSGSPTVYTENYDFQSESNANFPGLYNCVYTMHCETGKATCQGPANPVWGDAPQCAYYWWWYFVKNQQTGICQVTAQSGSSKQRIPCS